MSATTPPTARILVLGNPAAGDDGAGLAAAARLGDDLEVVAAGRPGAGLLELLVGDRPMVLVDVVRSGAPPGTIHRVPLAALPDAAVARAQVSSHGFGPAEALELGRVLGREPPPGWFIGVEGAHFGPGDGLSAEVAAALDAFTRAIRDAAQGG